MTRLLERLGRYQPVLVNLLFWAGVLSYVVTFSLLSLAQYHAYLPHALDLGNMAQTAWNTIHGLPFQFQNQRLLHTGFEGYGISTRLGVHAEPIFPVIALIYGLWQHVESLLVLQTLAAAAGAWPVRLLARRHLGRGLPELVFPLAYLLVPALEAANLDEFHPVVFAAPLLLWAFYLADGRRYSLFTLAAVGAIGCKEELGLLVAAIALFWIALRNGDRRFGALVAVLSVLWSVVAVKLVVPDFAGRDSSYWGRYLPPFPYQKPPHVTQSDVMQFWWQHPGQVLDSLRSEAKLSYLHRLLYPLGYLSLLSPVTLAAGIPSLLLILLSYEPHMYGGVAHYSVELVPVVVVSAILGTKLAGRVLAARLRLAPALTVTACCLYILGASLANQRVNGFSPLAQGFAVPPVTQHDQLLDQVLASIPADASVSAQDQLDAHLSDRGSIFQYPDLDSSTVQYIVLDATQSTGDLIPPCQLYMKVVGRAFPKPAAPEPCDTAVNSAGGEVPNGYADETLQQSTFAKALLNRGAWSIRYARDGILLLEHGKPKNTADSTLPPAFYSFITPWSAPPQHHVVARFGDELELDGYSIARRETTNLRVPDVVITTWWRVLKAPTQALTLMHYVSDNTGIYQTYSSDQPATDWLPIATWQVGHTYMVQSEQLTVKTTGSGAINLDIGIDAQPNLLSASTTAYQDTSHNLAISLENGGGTAGLVGPCACHVLHLDSVEAHL